MPVERRHLVIDLLAVGVLALGALAFALWQVLAGDGDDFNPWLFCTTNPCQPLALVQVPTPPALSNDASLAAACVIGGENGEGILLWHTDWDPLEAQGMCVSNEEAEDLGADLSSNET